MKQIKTILALLLCLCMLPLNALAYTVDHNGTHQSTIFTPEESWLYTVKIQKDGETLPYLPAGAGEAPYNPAIVASVTCGTVAAQEVDYNVFGLAAAVPYTVQLKKLAETLDDSGEWDVTVNKVAIQKLDLNADTFKEGEWFSLATSETGEYTFAASTRPVFIEVFARGEQSGDWEGYANDKEAYRIGVENLASGTEQLNTLKAENLKTQADVETAKAEIKGLEAALEKEKSTYDNALKKLEAYRALINLADEQGLIGEIGNNSSREMIYNLIIKPAAARRGVEIPDDFIDFPAFAQEQLESNQTIRDAYDRQQAELEQKCADLEALQSTAAAETEAIAAAEEELAKGKSQLDALRDRIQSDADKLMSAPAVDDGLALQDAVWLLEANDVFTTTLKSGEVYTIHVLSNSPVGLSVTEKADAPINKDALEQAIDNADDVDRSKYTPESLAAMDAALQAARDALENAATQDEIDAATEALKEAIAALAENQQEPDPVNKTALQNAIKAAKAVDQTKYTDDSVAAMNKALSDAEAVKANEDAAQAEIDAAAKALNDAIAALKDKEETTDKVDKTALNEAIEKAEAIERDKYTDSSLRVLDAALNAAKRLAESDSALITQGMVDFAANALNAAINTLQEIEPSSDVDKTALQSAITAAEGKDTSKYTDDSVAAMTKALNDAKAVDGNADATQAEVDAAAKALNEAVAALKEKEVTPTAADKTALQKAIQDAEAVDTSKYTDDSVAAMTKALNDAKTVNGNADATQADVDAAAQALNDAVKALKEKENTSQGADKTELKKAIQAAEAIDRSKYTDDSVDQLDRILSYAKSVDADKDASQARVTNAAALLNNAIDDLKEKSADPQQPDKCDGGANCPSKIFKDVNQKKWYHEAIDYAIVNKLFNGTSPNTFEPDTAMTRGMLVTVLYRMENEPGAKTTPAFTDLRQNWYKTAVAWAAENKIVNGIDATHFAPDAKVTREQAMTMLMRYAQFKGYDTSAREDLSAFKDAASVRSWALDAMQWGVSVGLIQGVGGGLLDPRGDSSRAQVATILMRFRENIAK